MHPLLRQLLATARARNLFPAPGLAVVAVSGGPDSVALVHALNELSQNLRLELLIAHLDHGLRGEEAVGDAAAVGELAGELGLPAEFGVRRVSPEPGESVEEAARNLRYDFLGEVASRYDAAYLAIGHTADDQAETLLLRLLRGAGPRGLQAMTPLTQRVGVDVVRPLLDTSREVVRSYLSDRQVSFRIDRTNSDLRLPRNRIRRVLMPLLQAEFNPAITATLGRTAELMNEVDHHLTGLADRALDSGVLREGPPQVADLASEQGFTDGARDRPGLRPAGVPNQPRPAYLELDLPRLSTYDLILQRYLLRQAMLRLCSDLRGIGFDHIDALLDLARGGQRSRRIDLPGGVVGLREGDGLSLWAADPGEAGAIPLTILPLGSQVGLEEVGLEVRTEVVKLPELTADSMVSGPGEDPDEDGRLKALFPGWARLGEDSRRAVFDRAALRLPLAIRSRQVGDRILPFGKTISKKVKDLLIDAKVPRRLRSAVPLIVDGAGGPEERILWIAGHRRSAHAPVIESTTDIVEVQISRSKS